MNALHTTIALLGLSATLWPLPAHAQERRLDAQQAAGLATENNPGLRAALLERQRADLQVAAEEDLYPLILQMDAGATHMRSPSLSTSGVTTSTNDSVVLGSELRKAFSWGTSFAFRVEGSWSQSRFPVLPNAPQELTLGPGWGLAARLSVLQPLLRGAGTDAGEAQLRAAELDRTAAQKAADRVASELLRDVLVSYWELWYAAEAGAIEEAAREVSERERNNLRERIDEGDAAPVAIHPFETRVAELDEAVLAAKLERDRRAVELGVKLAMRGDRAKQLVAAAAGPPKPSPLPSDSSLITKAMQSSPELAELDAQIDSSRDREKVAGETDRQRLDLEGWLQTEGLGNREVPPALEQFGKFGAFSAHVGLVYELPLTGSRYASQQAAAHAGTEVIESRREALRQQIEADVTVLLDRLDVAGQRVALARRTAEVAEAEQKAANDRLELGDAIAIEVQRAEDALRQAKLRTARARVDWVQAKMALDHLTGELLRSYADQIPIAKPRDAGALAPRRRVALRHGPY